MGALLGIRAELAEALKASGAVTFSRERMPVVVNVDDLMRQNPDLVARCLLAVISMQDEGLRFGYIAGKGSEGEKVVETLIQVMEEAGHPRAVEQLFLTKEPVSDQRIQLSDSFILGGTVLLVVPTLQSPAPGLLQTLDRIQAADLTTTAVLAVIDFNDRAYAQIVGKHIVPLAVVSLGELLDHYLKDGTVDEETYIHVRQWLSQR